MLLTLRARDCSKGVAPKINLLPPVTAGLPARFAGGGGLGPAKLRAMSTRPGSSEPLPEGLRTVDEALHRTRFRILPFLGPAFIACVAYIDPGNFATNIAGGSKYGYTLVWVIVASNLMAVLIQTLSAKLGIATGKNLPEVCRDRFSRRTSILLWLQAEGIAMATDLAEFLGAAIGFNLLLGTSLLVSTVLTAIASFAILGLQRFGFRPFEAVIAAIVGVIGACYLIELFYSNPDLAEVGKHAIIPEFQGSGSVVLAVGILGATVMPHVIYLHSALTQDRIVPESQEDARVLMRYTRIDVIIAMSLAGLINLAMLVMAASTFAKAACRASIRSRPPTRRSSRSSAAPRACSSRSPSSAPACPRPPSARSPARS